MEQSELSPTIANMIRERSKANQLMQFEEILTELLEKGLCESEIVRLILGQVLREHDDLREISGRNGLVYYYSMQSLSETYAGILVRKHDDPLELIAHVVRESSARYPRPVPLDIFGETPFDLSQDEVLECIERLGVQGGYEDIALTATSVGTTFLYSNRHLEPDHASALAEWLDAGQVNNP